jgi:hypothetical protein
MFMEILGNYTVFDRLFTANQLLLGILVKGYLVIQFAFAYWYSRESSPSN